MKFKAEDIARYLGGEVEGDPLTEVTAVAKIEDGHPGALSFLANPAYEKYIYTTESSVVLVNKTFRPISPISAVLIRVENAYEAFASLLTLYEKSLPARKGISDRAFIEESAVIGDGVYIAPFVYIGSNVKIGDNCSVYSHTSIEKGTVVGDSSTIYNGVKIYHDCIIGKECIIHAGSVIGSDGFGFAPQSDHDYRKIPQIGNVILEERVEIGANSVIDRATMGSTIIRRGVKLDNLIQIAHNVEVGENSVMAAQTGVAGSTKIGPDCMFGGQVGVTGHITVAAGTKAAAQTGIGGHVRKEGSVLYGSPAFDLKDFQKSYIIFRKLPYLKERVDRMEEVFKKDNKL